MTEDRVSVSVREPTLSTALQVTAILELLEEAGILTQQKVLDRMRAIMDRKKPG